MNEYYRDPAAALSEDQLLLRKRVLYQVETFPATFHMDWWDTALIGFPVAAPDCITVRCLAGWALYLSGSPVRHDETAESVERRATRAMGLTEAERHSSWFGDLFYDDNGRALLRMRELASAGVS
jgi:hypothetical protein